MRKQNLTMLVAIAALVVSCGIDPSKYQQSTTTGTETDTSTSTAPTDGKTDKTTTLTKEDKWRFSPQTMTFEEALASAPEGWRIPTRVEIIEGFDGEEFKWAKDKQKLSVWSSTEYIYDDEHVGWSVELTIGKAFLDNKKNVNQVLYIQEHSVKIPQESIENNSETTVDNNEGNTIIINNNNCSR